MEDLLRGERVRLTALSDQDVPALAAWQRDGEFLRLLDAVPAYPKTEAQLVEWLEQHQKSAESFGFGIRLMDDDRLLGYLELDGVLWNQGTAWVSIGLGERANWGRGYGTEALGLALRFAFQELNLRRVQLTVFSYNTRAITSYEKLGFTREGVFREALLRDGAVHDMYLYGLLRREWEARER